MTDEQYEMSSDNIKQQYDAAVQKRMGTPVVNERFLRSIIRGALSQRV